MVSNYRFRKRVIRQTKKLRLKYLNFTVHGKWKRNSGIIEMLPEPVFAGYKKFFIIRQDVLNRHDIDNIKNLLDMLNTTIKSKSKSFKRKVSKGVYEIVEPKLKSLTDSEFFDLDDGIQKYFIREYCYDKSRYKWECAYPWFFITKTIKYYYYSRIIPDSESDSKSDRAYNYLETHNLIGTLNNKFFGSYNWNDFDYGFYSVRIKNQLTSFYTDGDDLKIKFRCRKGA